MNEHTGFDEQMGKDDGYESNAIWHPEEIDAPDVWGITSFDDLLPDYVAW